jgi:hypothetical protein
MDHRTHGTFPLKEVRVVGLTCNSAHHSLCPIIQDR